MDPWMGENETYVRGICDKLVANEPNFTELSIEGAMGQISNKELLRLIAKASKRNTTLKKLQISGGFNNSLPNWDGEFSPMAVSVARSLARSIATHPSLQRICFGYGAKFVDFNAISLAIIQNTNLKHLEMADCYLSPNLMENLAYLVEENALESLCLGKNCDEDGNGLYVDLPGVFQHNESLKS